MANPPLWQIQEGASIPILATAIHDGHAIRDSLHDYLHITPEERYREEDPHTGTWAKAADSWIVVNRSRFEVDLNRSPEKAVYRTRKDAWGLKVWSTDLPDDELATSLAIYDDFHTQANALITRLIHRFGRIVVLDIHSYCHRRDGPYAPPAPQNETPDVNIGTSNMDRTYWAPVVEGFRDAFSELKVNGNLLYVDENVRFLGGHFARWIHDNFPKRACVLSIELKKIFMDEWTGEADYEMIDALGQALQQVSTVMLQGLNQVEA